MRSAAALPLLIALLIALATPAFGEVEVRIRFGHGQEAIAGAITPLVIEFESRESAPVGVRIQTRPGTTLGAGEVCRAADVLSPGSTRQITLLYRPYARTRPQIDLAFDRSVVVVHESTPSAKAIREITLSPPKPSIERGGPSLARYTLLTVGPGSNQLPFPPEGLRVLPMEEKDLPTVWHAYDGVDAVLLRKPAEGRPIAPERIQALLEFVEAGGRLVITTNRPERLTEIGLAPYLPATQSLEEPLDLTAAEVAVPFSPRKASQWGEAPGRHKVPVFRLTPGPGARVLASLTDSGLPLVVERRHGYGSIVMVAFDTARLRQLTSGRAIVAHAVMFGGWMVVTARENPALAERRLFPSVGYIMGGSVNDQPVTEILKVLRAGAIRPPPMGLLFLFMVLYILAVGPIDYWILKKRNLLKWSAVTFLGLAVLFSVSAWYVSFHLFAGAGKLNRVTFVDVLPQGDDQPDRLIVQDFAGHYAPVGAQLDLEPRGETAHVSDFADPSSYEGGGGLQRSPVELAFASPARATGRLLVPFRSLRTTRTLVSRRETFPVDVTFDRNRQQVTVRNGLTCLLRDVTLLHGGRAIHVGDIGPGAEGTADLNGGRITYRPIDELLSSTSEAPSTRDILETGERLLPLTWAGAGFVMDPGEIDEWSEHFRRLAKMGIDRSPAVTANTSVLVAWTEERNPVGLAGSDADGFSLTFLRKVVSR